LTLKVRWAVYMFHASPLKREPVCVGRAQKGAGIL
jgi:hypothetical protein